jgi:hypothetical protein
MPPMAYYDGRQTAGPPAAPLRRRTVPDLARSWDSLAGWLRGLIVTGVVVLCFTIVLIVCLTIAG